MTYKIIAVATPTTSALLRSKLVFIPHPNSEYQTNKHDDRQCDHLKLPSTDPSYRQRVTSTGQLVHFDVLGQCPHSLAQSHIDVVMRVMDECDYCVARAKTRGIDMSIKVFLKVISALGTWQVSSK